MKDFAAIDFETANECRSSVCSVGPQIAMADGHFDKREKTVQEAYEEIKKERGMV